MVDMAKQTVVGALLGRYGRGSFAEDAEIHLKQSPHSMFQLLQLAALTDARVDPDTAVHTFTALRGQRLSTAGQVLGAGSGPIAQTLAEAGYPEGDRKRITTAMTDAALHLQEEHGGDLNELREDAGRDPARERDLLGHFAGVNGDVIDAFCREAQLIWDELGPFADKKALDAASRLGLGEDTAALRSLVREDREFVRLVDALVRVRHDKSGYQELRQLADEA
ncbi:hypothetical protein [Streptomyces litchfieldiae]|uniref:Uncharacterized protein n=1 Tax=Streptomyces litchfieldiae TaxID=3075543 RepID=A0ABU2MV00_9ACTN|nr:hypothetical protein [Streptomyces sp. DSM 44938]MDT0345470.1 hypothetical protein [Streptomyces sp. DSM 44938]